MKTYKTLRGLANAIRSGRLKLSSRDRMVVDNDAIYLYVGTGPNDVCVYSSDNGLEEAVGDALTALGIPWERA